MVTMLRSRGVRPGRFHSSASGPCAYFSSAGATVVMSCIVGMGFLPYSEASACNQRNLVFKRYVHEYFLFPRRYASHPPQNTLLSAICHSFQFFRIPRALHCDFCRGGVEFL